MLLNPVSAEEPAAGASVADDGMGEDFPAVPEDELPQHEGAPVEEAVADDHKPRAKRPPVLPCTEKMARHCLTHIPFRSWGELCVQASAPDDPHRRSEDEPTIDEVQLDYMMLGPVGTAEEFEEAERGEFMIRLRMQTASCHRMSSHPS